MIKKASQLILATLILSVLSGCGFHLQSKRTLASPLKTLYLQTDNPYGVLAKNLSQLLKASDVRLVSNKEFADTVLVIFQSNDYQDLISVNISQQTRQYNLRSVVIFTITDKNGNLLVAPQTLSENRSMTVQTNLVLGGSNQADIIFKQMRVALARDVMNRLASFEVNRLIKKSFTSKAISESTSK